MKICVLVKEVPDAAVEKRMGGEYSAVLEHAALPQRPGAPAASCRRRSPVYAAIGSATTWPVSGS